MKKSKFLKKSLAALLAILMVAAMIPLSAAAEDAPAPSVDDPEIWVNSQKAELDSDGNYTVKVEDTASMSIRDNTETGYTMYAILKRTESPDADAKRIEEKLPYSRLDLRSEAFEIEENVSYYVDLELRKNTDLTTAVKTYKLTINLEDTTAFDTTDLRAVRVNQLWREGSVDYRFNAVKGEYDNAEHTITITLPVGFRPEDAGFGAATDFGAVVGTTRTAPTSVGSSQWRQVFVPQSPDAAVQYIGPGTDKTKAQVVVTARDGRTATYDVTFKYEQALTDISIMDRYVGVSGTDQDLTGAVVGQASGITMTASGQAVIYIPVESNIDDWFTGYETHDDHWSLLFTKGEGTIRVEDPQSAASVIADGADWAPNNSAATGNKDLPLVSEFNTIDFVPDDGAPTAYLTVITQANWYEDDSNYGRDNGTLQNRDSSKGDNQIYRNVKIILTKGVQGGTSTGGTSVKVTEIQLDGYEAVVNKDGFTPGQEIEIYVDNDAYQAPGWDTNVRHRLTVTSNGTKLTIPEQNNSSTDAYWQVPVISLASGRLEKAVLSNVNVAGHRFNLQVATNGQVANFPIVLKKAGSYGTEMTHFRLYDAVNKKWYNGVKDSANGKQFNVTIPESLLKNKTVLSSTVALNDTASGAHAIVLSRSAILNTKGTHSWSKDGTYSLDFSGLATTTAFNAALKDLDLITSTATEITATYDSAADVINLFVGTTKVAFVDTATKTFGSAADAKLDVYKASDTGKTTSIGQVSFVASESDYPGAGSPSSTHKFTFEAGPIDGVDNTGKTTLADIRSTGIKLTYHRPITSVEISDWLAGLEVYAHVSKGAVTTPGDRAAKTTWTGLNGDPNGTYTTGVSTTYVPSSSSPEYSEIENSVTKLGDIWTTNYTKGHDDTYDETLYLTVSNGTTNTQYAEYTVKLVKEGKPGGITDGDVSTDATLSVESAMSGIDGNLIHGGNTVTDITSNAKDGQLVTNPAAANDRAGREIDPDNAAYIGTKDETTFEVEEKSLGDGASALVIKVPYDFDEDSKVYFWNAKLNGKTDNSKGNIVRWNPAGTPNGGAAGDGVYEVVADDYSLDPYTQTRQDAGIMSFEFTTDEIANAWNGSKVNASAVSKKNILYAYSEKDKNKWTDHVTATPGDDDADITTTKNGATTPNHIYYVVLERQKANADTSLKTFVPDTTSQASATVNWTSKIITLTVPFSWNWSSYRDDDSKDFTIDFGLGANASLIDVYHDTARLTDVPMKAVHSNSTQVDVQSQYINQLQDFNAWKANETKFFVKDGELYIFNKASGEEIQVTGLGNNTDDQYRNAAHNNITDGNTELRIYDEAKKNINTYKLVVNVGSANRIADIGTIKVGEDFAKADENDELSYNVTLPADSDLTNLALEITTASPLASSVQVTTVAGTETYDSTQYLTKRWDLSEGATIVITAEDGVTKKTYKLSVNNSDAEPTPTPTPTPPVTDEPTPTPDILDQYTDLDQIGSSMYDEVVKALRAGLVQGVTTTEFAPKSNMTRYQFALIIARAKLLEEGFTGNTTKLDAELIARYGTETPFDDLTGRGDAAKAAIAYCYAEGYMKGLSETKFNPNGKITRQEAAVAMARVAGLSEDDTDVSIFIDGDKIANWAKGYVKAAYDAGLIKGYPEANDAVSFRATTLLTREQGACLLTRQFLKEDENPGDDDNNPGDDDNNGDDDTNTPDEGDTGDDADTPDEGDTGDDTNTPDEGDTGDDANTPDEGDAGDDANTGDDATE